VQALSENAAVMPRLARLVRKELIRPDRTQLPGDDAFRFRHLLVRDAAYDALPKSTRAELHERFADWLGEHGTDLIEVDEILGFHLEQAARYKAELGQTDPELSQRAGALLAAAGARSLARADRRGAAPLLERALELKRPWGFDGHVELQLADAQIGPRATRVIAEAVAERAREAGDRVWEIVALVVVSEAQVQLSDEAALDELEQRCRDAFPLLEEAGDHAGLGRVWAAYGFGISNLNGRMEEWAHAAEQTVRHFRLAGIEDFGLAGLPTALVYGPRPADEALQTLDAALAGPPSASVSLRRAGLLAMLGRYDEAWAIGLPAAERTREMNADNSGDFALAEIAVLAGDQEAAVHWFRRACDAFERQGSSALLSSYAPKMGRCLCALGRYDEADELADLGRALGDERDYVTQMYWREVKALVLSHRGEHGEAERLAREAVQVTEATDGLNDQGDAYYYLGQVLANARRSNDAAAAFEQALDRFGRKKNVAMIAQVKPKLEELRARVP
jgi:tetratricopeptide (TPR) repeat protein